ncbi:ABC transporter [Fusarium beomiforme]|uniref:ABC transporter n=1 Tax=Fusarium beomiforme TaxID=44412 RepID=A0A9P5DZX1_9HYPO|nr:ABC transporter [Fusarium beomiforme]
MAALEEGLERALLPGTKIALKLLLVGIISQSKQAALRKPFDSQPPEQLAGILSRTFFWWINPILALGNRIILSEDSLPPIDDQLSSKYLRRRGLKAWDRRARPETKTTLPIILAKAMLSQFLAPVIPRLFLISFRYAQPVLISSAVRMLSDHSSGNRHLLIVEAAAVYCGLAMLGFSTETESLLQSLRVQELKMAKKVRWMMVTYNASANALGIFSPILTFIVFVITARLRGRALDAETAFTTTALLGLVTHPANMIMTIVPRVVGALAAFGRIQDYLVEPGRSDEKQLIDKAAASNSSNPAPAVCFEAVIVQPVASPSPLLQEMNLVINRGSLLICAGAVGSGKTVFAKCILGEIPALSGRVSVSSKTMAYCEQSPWLPSGTIKEAVCGFGKLENDWYRYVVKLCCLHEDISTMPLGDDTVIGSRGMKLSGGQRQRIALARAVYARCVIVLLDDSFSALDGKTESQVVTNLLGPEGHFRKTGVTVVLTTNSVKHFDLADSVVLLENGKVTYQGPPDGLKEEATHLSQLHDNLTAPEANADHLEGHTLEVEKTVRGQALKVTEAMTDLSRSTGDFSLYGYYLRAVKPRNLFFLLTCTASYSFFVTFPQYWLQKWTDAPISQTNFYVGGYIVLSLLAWTATNGSMCAQKLLTATLPICILVVYVVQRVYLRTSRQLRLLQLESQSAVYSSFLESIEGVVSIRSFGWVKQAETANMDCLDKSQQPAYILFCLQRWLNIVLDLIIAAIAVSMITLAVFLEGSTTAGQIGMSLNIVLVANSTLVSLVTSWTNMEISLGAISRLKTLEAVTEVEEKDSTGIIVPESWPSPGAVEIRDVTVSYKDTQKPALNNISLDIKPGHHFVICGRTGSGKSTLLLALLRLVNAQSGSIEVDGIDLSQVPLSIIRERCFITVTQDPFLLAQASLRFNLDPSRSLADSTIVKALQCTGLWQHFDPNQHGDILDEPIGSLPHMSAGQGQLFALARAILRVEHSSMSPTPTKPILLLDEATSSVDGATESTMRDIIKKVFTDNGHTIIEITHRLGGIREAAGAIKDGPEITAVLLSQGFIKKQEKIDDVLDLASIH